MEHIGLYLRDIYFKKRKGRLSFHFQAVQKYLFFLDGLLVSARTNHPDELLGEVLFRLGKLSRDDYDRIEEHIHPRKSIGAVLMEKGLITRESLQQGLAYQMREIVLNMFSVFEGEFNFQDNVDFSEQTFDVTLRIPMLIEEGIRGMKYHPALKDFLEDKILVSTSIDFYLRLTEAERELLGKVPGDIPAGEWFRSGGFEAEFFWKSLYLFYCLDLVGFEEKKSRPAVAGKEPLTDNEMNRIVEVFAFQEKLAAMNYYQILQVTNDAPSEEIKKAYFRLARKYHPDLFRQELSEEQMSVVDDVFDRITKAYQMLSNKEKRREYDDRLAAPPEEKGLNQAKEAEKRFRQGKTLYDQGRYEDALIFLEQCVRLDQEKANYFLLLALTQSKLPSYRKEAEKNFLRAAKIQPWNTEAYIGLGLLYKREGLQLRARKQFEKALKIDPGHTIALKELGRSETKAKKPGMKGFSLKDLLKMDVFGKRKKK